MNTGSGRVPEASSRWSRYKLPIFLAFVAIGLYGLSIYWIMQTRGGA